MITLSLDAARTRTIRGFVKSLAIFMVVSALFWGVGFRAPLAVVLAPVMPLIFGVSEARHLDGAGCFSLGLSLITIFAVGLAIDRADSKLLRRLAHFCLCFYWFWSFCVLGLGV